MERSHRYVYPTLTFTDESMENLREEHTASTLSLESVASALPKPTLHLTTNSIYTSRDPVRQSLNDISQSHTDMTGAENETPQTTSPITIERPRSSSSVSATSITSTSTQRRKAPAPPKIPQRGTKTSRKLSVNSNGTGASGSVGSYESENGFGGGSLPNDMGHSFGARVDGEMELVKEGGKGVPTPIIEVCPPVKGWTTFMT